jgi:hypothetical protein
MTKATRPGILLWFSSDPLSLSPLSSLLSPLSSLSLLVLSSGEDFLLCCAQVFRGTHIKADWLVNFDIKISDLCPDDVSSPRVHQGFLHSLTLGGVDSCAHTILQVVLKRRRLPISEQHPRVARLMFTGHSLGGAYATTMLLLARKHRQFLPVARSGGRIPTACVTFGAPLVLARSTAEDLDLRGLTCFVHGFDVVPRLLGERGVLEHLASLTSRGRELAQAASKWWVGEEKIQDNVEEADSEEQQGIGIVSCTRRFRHAGTYWHFSPSTKRWVQCGGQDLSLDEVVVAALVAELLLGKLSGVALEHHGKELYEAALHDHFK